MPGKPTYEELEQKVRELEAAESEWKKTEADLRESRNKYRTLFEDANDAIFVASTETGIILDANQKAEQLTGRPRNEIIGTHQTALHPNSQETYAETAFQQDAKQKNVVFYDDFLIQHADGRNIPVEISPSFIEMRGTPCVLGIFRDVTEKRERMESLQRYESVIKAVTDPVSYVDRNYTYRVVNDAYPKYFRKPKEEIVGHPIWEMMGKDQFENVIRPRLDRCFAGETVWYEEWFSFPDGNFRYSDVRYYPVFDDDGIEVIGVSAFSRDHTAQKEAEQALKESERKFRNIADNVPGLVLRYKLNPDGSDELLYISKGVADLYEVSPEDALKSNKLLWDRIHRDELEEIRASIKESAENLSFWKQEHRIELPDGRVKWVHTQGVPNKENDGSVVWDTLALNITERKQMESELNESRALLEATGRMARVGGWEMDAVTSAVKWTEETCRINEVPLDYQPPLDKAILFYPPEVREELTQAIQKALDHGEPYDLEVPFITAKGKRLWARTICRPVVAYGKTVKLSGTFQDITDRKRAEAALQKSLAEKEVLLREIHHRVKNNMQAIIGLLRMHARRTNDAHLTEIFTDCRDRIGAMSLIHEALYQSDNLARIDFEAYLKKLCRNLAQAHDAPRRGITLTSSAAAVSMNMDRGVAVGMIIAELISNAFKHAFPDDGGGAVSVHLDLPDGETVRLVVSDTGKGLPPDFDIQNPPSLGMRLVVGAVTRELGGSIEATSDGGARFIIRFKQRPTRF